MDGAEATTAEAPDSTTEGDTEADTGTGTGTGTGGSADPNAQPSTGNTGGSGEESTGSKVVMTGAAIALAAMLAMMV